MGRFSPLNPGRKGNRAASPGQSIDKGAGQLNNNNNNDADGTEGRSAVAGEENVSKTEPLASPTHYMPSIASSPPPSPLLHLCLTPPWGSIQGREAGGGGGGGG
ncbi:unnamed protein product [Merluccius merluccius]